VLITDSYTTPPLGPVEEDKIPVVVRRIQEARVDAYTIFYETIVAGRSTVSPRANIGAAPSLMFNACLDAILSLKNEGVECFFADGEADPCCAGLAARYNGYVLALDSDYMIFNASYKGYIPLDDLVWVLPDNTGFSNDSDGFQTGEENRHPRSAKFNTSTKLLIINSVYSSARNVRCEFANFDSPVAPVGICT